jgi:hypothetical protein
MSCEEYSGWMTDAALGGLRAEREPELLSHAMECEVCREALSHATRVRELVERGIESLVDGEPSPQFLTDLRRRIAQESNPMQPRWMAWTPVAAGALTLAILLAVLVARTPSQHGSDPSAASSLSPARSSPSASAASGLPGLNPQIAASKSTSERLPRAHRANAVLPKIIVPKGQLLAAARLSEAIHAGRVDGSELLAAQQEYGKPLEVKPIEIAPLESPAPNDATEIPTTRIQF